MTAEPARQAHRHGDEQLAPIDAGRAGTPESARRTLRGTYDHDRTDGPRGLLCLQGGRELTPACVPMDRAILERTGPLVTVLAGAARPGDDYEGASHRTRTYYEALGATVTVVPDPRDDPGRALEVFAGDVDLLVMPGGSPDGLLGVLSGPIGERVRTLHATGVAISGASAGAMVLCDRTILPGAGTIEAGLGLAVGIAIPHWSPGAERRWSLPPTEMDGVVWGLPECGGVVVHDDTVRAVGAGTPSQLAHGDWVAIDRDRAVPSPR